MFQNVTPKKDRAITFDSLIKAARSTDASDNGLETKLDKLREARNTIHLGAHIARKQKEPRAFGRQDRKEAKEVMEEMRLQLASCYKPQKA